MAMAAESGQIARSERREVARRRGTSGLGSLVVGGMVF
jgi:hypothetical protein